MSTSLWTKLGGRKLIAYVLGLGTLSAFSLTGNLSEISLIGILALTTVFTGGNVGEHIASISKIKLGTKTPD